MSYSSTVLTDSPIRYYRLDETSGTSAIDAGSQAQNGTYTGGVTLNQTSLLASDADPSVLLDGSTGYIVTANTASVGGLSALSVEFWAQVTAFGSGFGRVVNAGDTGSTHTGFDFYLDETAHALNIIIGNGTTSVWGNGTPVISAGTAYHIVCVYNGSTIQLYLNGVAVSGTSLQSGTIGTPTAAITIGSLAGGSCFPGTLDEVAIYSTALSSARVRAHYTAGTVHWLIGDGYGGVCS